MKATNESVNSLITLLETSEPRGWFAAAHVLHHISGLELWMEFPVGFYRPVQAWFGPIQWWRVRRAINHMLARRMRDETNLMLDRQIAE